MIVMKKGETKVNEKAKKMRKIAHEQAILNLTPEQRKRIEEQGIEGVPRKKKKKKSFGDAFREAKDKGLKTFEWDGKKYSTKTKDD